MLLDEDQTPTLGISKLCQDRANQHMAEAYSALGALIRAYNGNTPLADSERRTATALLALAEMEWSYSIINSENKNRDNTRLSHKHEVIEEALGFLTSNNSGLLTDEFIKKLTHAAQTAFYGEKSLNEVLADLGFGPNG